MLNIPSRNVSIRFGSGSDFRKSFGSGPGSYFWKVMVPVPVPAPYLDYKKQIFQKILENIYLFTQ